MTHAVLLVPAVISAIRQEKPWEKALAAALHIPASISDFLFGGWKMLTTWTFWIFLVLWLLSIIYGYAWSHWRISAFCLPELEDMANFAKAIPEFWNANPDMLADMEHNTHENLRQAEVLLCA